LEGSAVKETVDIVVVDDDENICQLVRLYLEKEGYSVVCANTGTDGAGTRGYFEVRDLSDPENNTYEYKYSIYTRGRELHDSGVVDRYPQISYPDITKWNGFLKLSMYYFGMAGDTCRYYDIDKGLVSDWFSYPVGECDTFVVCVDSPAFATMLIVQSIFDDSYYREFPMRFLQGWGDVLKPQQQAPVISVEFINDNSQLRVTYEDEEGCEKTTTLDLY
jgi:hypothetical protein